MKKNLRAFTMIELMIVVLMLNVMAGVVGVMWLRVERMAKVSTDNVMFSIKAQTVLSRIEKDINHSFQVSQSESALLLLTQLSADGAVKKITYTLENGELIRNQNEEGKNDLSMKIANLGNAQFLLEKTSDGAIRMEWFEEAKGRPLDVRPKRLITFVKGSQLHP